MPMKGVIKKKISSYFKIISMQLDKFENDKYIRISVPKAASFNLKL